MINVKFEINEKKLKDELEKQAFTILKKEINNVVKKKLTLSELKKIEIKIKGRNIENLSIEYRGPEDIVEKIKRELKKYT